MRKRSKVLIALACGMAAALLATTVGAVTIRNIQPNEDVFSYVQRTKGDFDQVLYQQVIGAASAFKEGDEAIGVAADDEASRENARKLLANSKIKDLLNKSLFVDEQEKLIMNTTDPAQYAKVKNWTMGELKTFLLTKSEADGCRAEVTQRIVWPQKR